MGSLMRKIVGEDDPGKAAAKAQVKAGEMAVAEQRRQYDQTREDLAPYREAAYKSLGSLQDLIYDPNAADRLMNNPAYKFRTREGQRMLESSAAAKGGLFSGGTGIDLVNYGQEAASAEYQNTFSRLATLSGLSTPGVMQGVQAGGQISANISGLMQQRGDAIAAGIINSANLQQQQDQQAMSAGLAAAALFI